MSALNPYNPNSPYISIVQEMPLEKKAEVPPQVFEEVLRRVQQYVGGALPPSNPIEALPPIVAAYSHHRIKPDEQKSET